MRGKERDEGGKTLDWMPCGALDVSVLLGQGSDYRPQRTGAAERT